jgi:hypothetical protein
MTIINASCLSLSDLRSLGPNVAATVARDRHGIRAINRSLSTHGEAVERLYPRAASSRTPAGQRARRGSISPLTVPGC